MEFLLYKSRIAVTKSIVIHISPPPPQVKGRRLAEIDPASRGWRARTPRPDSDAVLVREVYWATASIVDPKSRAATGPVSTVTISVLKNLCNYLFTNMFFFFFLLPILNRFFRIETCMILFQMK